MREGIKKHRKAHREYVMKWRAASHDKYSGPGRRIEELPERYRPIKQSTKKGKSKKKGKK